MGSVGQARAVVLKALQAKHVAQLPSGSLPSMGVIAQ
jgi:hypothetical protein